MKKTVLILYLLFSVAMLRASLLKIKEILNRPNPEYLLTMPLLEKLDFKTQKEEKLKFIAELIRKAKATGTGSSKIYTLPVAYEAYARIKVSSNKNWNNVKFLLDAYIKNGEDKNDKNALQPKMMLRSGFACRFMGMLNNNNYKDFIDNYDRLSETGKQCIISLCTLRITDQGIIPFYIEKLTKGIQTERVSAAIGLTKIKNTNIDPILIKYIEANRNDLKMNSIILQLLVRRGVRSELIYQLIEKCCSEKDEVIHFQGLKAATVVATPRVKKYVKEALKEHWLKRPAGAAMKKITTEESKQNNK